VRSRTVRRADRWDGGPTIPLPPAFGVRRTLVSHKAIGAQPLRQAAAQKNSNAQIAKFFLDRKEPACANRAEYGHAASNHIHKVAANGPTAPLAEVYNPQSRFVAGFFFRRPERPPISRARKRFGTATSRLAVSEKSAACPLIICRWRAASDSRKPTHWKEKPL